MPLTYDLLKKQSGFILPSPTMLLAGVLAAACLALAIQTWRLDASQKEHITFVAGVKALGEAAEVARKKDIEDRAVISTKKETDHGQRIATLDAKYRAALIRLRDKHPGSGEAKPLSSAATELNCANGQSDITGGLDRLEIGILALLERGDRAIERTVTCKSWIDEQVAK